MRPGMFAPNTRGRWKLAGWLNRLPGMCWAQLVGWAMGDNRLRDTTQAYSVGGVNCRADAQRCGTCYCGRLDPAGATKRSITESTAYTPTDERTKR